MKKQFKLSKESLKKIQLIHDKENSIGNPMELQDLIDKVIELGIEKYLETNHIVNQKRKNEFKVIQKETFVENKVIVEGFNPKIDKLAGKKMIFDIIRDKYVKLTKEEEVRQRFIHFLIHQCKYPQALIMTEIAFIKDKEQKKADILIYGRNIRNFMLVECKSSEYWRLEQKFFDQAKEYNEVLKAKYFVVTNGFSYAVRTFDEKLQQYVVVKNMPEFE
ncbi:MAG: type I restriction enzyme HsdR N-terminal domain-containing protein [Thermoflexibacter sp.]|jgi:hypothetical protein|nr:type I restriction enzyme HsdR N-terminal domain-containing protein [Thermoflexibacter sp.]